MQKVKTDKMLSQLGHLNDEQFKVLFFIYNSINLNSDHTNRAKIYRGVLADLTNKSERTISRITDKLAEQGLIVKDCVSDGSKLYNYYGIPKTENKQKVNNEKPKTEEFLATDDRVKEPKSIESTKRTLKNIKEEKVPKRNDDFENVLKSTEEDENFEVIDLIDQELYNVQSFEELSAVGTKLRLVISKYNDNYLKKRLEDDIKEAVKRIKASMAVSPSIEPSLPF